MSNQYLRLVLGSGNGEPRERIQCLIETFESIRDLDLLTKEELDKLFVEVIKVLKPHKNEIEKLS